MTPSFETARLRLRPPTPDDADAVFAGWAQDPQVTRFLTWRPHRRVETVRAFLVELHEAMAQGGRHAWVLVERDGGQPVGMLDALIDGPHAVLGYVLARARWGRGYMTEAVGPVAAWALEQPGIHRVWAYCDVDNAASARVLEKAGFAFEGVLRRWALHPNRGDVPCDCRVYARIREGGPLTVGGRFTA
jgi:RimJ/RimL family protein N-acetyltransferase